MLNRRDPKIPIFYLKNLVRSGGIPPPFCGIFLGAKHLEDLGGTGSKYTSWFIITNHITFRFLAKPMDWFEANETCKNRGATLVEIDSEKENDQIVIKIKRRGSQGTALLDRLDRLERGRNLET